MASASKTPEVHILMNVHDEEELRVCVVRDGHIESLFHERLTNTQHLGNMYKAVVSNVEPSLDAAFLDIGGDKNGFIHVDEIEHDKGPGARIEKILRPGQELLVQISKEAIKDKGVCLTQAVSIPGRYLVLARDADGRAGVSRKIADEATRRRLKKLLDRLPPPEGFGFIVRTAAMDRLDEELELDHQYLTRCWEQIAQRAKRVSAPACLYQEADVVLRTLRDLVTAETTRIVIDKASMFEEAVGFAKIFMPEIVDRIRLHQDALPLFTAYGVEERLATLLDRKVHMPSGGNIVIEQTEALVSIDVNSSRNRSGDNVEQTALLTNLEAVQTISEQLLLRDLGGLIMIDFIDMEDKDHQRLVQLALRRALARDPAKTHVAAMSRFGIVEMTRQRRRPSHRLVSNTECPYCLGTGSMKTIETLAIESLRAVRAALNQEPLSRVEVLMPPDAAIGVLNARAQELAALEQQFDCRITIGVDPLMKQRGFRLQTVARKRRRQGRGQGRDEPVRPSVLAPLVERQSAVAAEARRLASAKLRDLEKEVLRLELGIVEKDERPERSTEPAAPAVAAPVVMATAVVAPQAPPSLWEEASALRALLFQRPSAKTVQAAPSALALSPAPATNPTPHERRRRRSR